MKIVGHRGARGLAQENTIDGLQKALDCQVDEIEVDVRVSGDGIPLLCHDRTLLRVAGLQKMIADCTYQELKSAKPDLCTLEDAIRYLNRRVPLLIEVKPREPTRPIVEVIERMKSEGWKENDFLLASYSQRTLVKLHAALPGVQKVINARWLSFWARRRAKQVGTRRLTMNQHFVWFGFVRAMSRDYELIPYTMNDPAKVRRWQRHGLAGCVTDNPELFRRQER